MEGRRLSKRSSESPEGPTKVKKRNKKSQDNENVDKENATNGVLLIEEETVSPSTRTLVSDDSDPQGDPTSAVDEGEVSNRDDEPSVGDAAEEEEDAMDEQEVDEAAETVTLEAASGRKKRKSSSALSNGSAEVGVITKIYCQDFMCHRKLTVDLNRNINFIHGQNGSGKSAILAAIQICLGASARRTHRAGSLKDMIRKDSGVAPSCAIVRVTLLNSGSDAYKPEEYGDMITVERRIAASGGYNGYKLLDENGKEKSRNKKDLDTMLDTLNIQVDNPVAVLDQEEAKKFLMGKDEEKYAFFMKATELENINRSVATMVQNRDELEVTIERKKEGLDAKLHHVQLLKQQLDEYQILEKLKLKEIKFIAEFCWANYGEVDSNYTQIMERLESCQRKLQAKNKEIKVIEEATSNPDEEVQNRRERIESLLAEVKEQEATKTMWEQELKEANRPYKENDQKLQALTRHIESAKKQNKLAKQRLKEKRQEILERESSAESEGARRTLELQNAEERRANAEAKANALKEEISKWLRAYEEAEGPVSHARREVEEITSRLRAVRSNIQSMENSSGNSLAVYGRNVAKVADLVSQARRTGKFRGPVFGPIGASLKIVPGKEAFAELAEHALGGVLDKFIVTNDNDSKIMRQIRQAARCQQDCGVFRVAESARYRIPPPPPEDGIETVASVLTIEDDIVFNCLVDNVKIDKKALGRDKNLTERALLVEAQGKLSIQGKIQAVYFLPRGDHWTVNSGAKAIFSNTRKMRRTIGVDTSAAIEAAQRDEQKFEKDLSEAKRNEAKLDHEHTAAMKQWNVAKRSCGVTLKEIEDLTEKIESIRTEIETTSSDNAVDTSEYEEDVEQSGEKVNELVKTEQDLRARLEELEPPIREIKAKLDDWSSRNHKIFSDIETAENDLTQILTTQSQHQDKMAKLQAKVDKYRVAADELRANASEIEYARNEELVKARKAHLAYIRTKKRHEDKEASEADGGPETIDEHKDREEFSERELDAIEIQEVSKSPDDCSRKIHSIRDRISEEKQKRGLRSGDEQQVRMKYMKARMQLQTETDEIGKLEEKHQWFEDDINERRAAWKGFRKNLVKKTSLAFGNMLGFTQYSGSLNFDHPNASLQLQVSKNSAAQSQSNDVKALSGGERSYTTMCLLLALGENLETPFRILDEFDVFLDSEVRKLTIRSLIHVAKKMKHRQFIFITPQDLSSVTPDRDLKILKLQPPDRYNCAGGPTQQTLD